MKGILLAGGSGKRLYPMTKSISKQLMPVYNKPLVYYPLSTLMLAGIREILVLTTSRDLESFKALLGDGSEIGMRFTYAVQEYPGGIAQAFLLGEEFIGNDRVALALGDNIFYGRGLSEYLLRAARRPKGATIFAYRVNDPKRYGVVEFDKKGFATNIVEKPKKTKSPYAVTGLYFYDSRVVEIAKKLKPSARGELEITDVNRAYLRSDSLSVEILGRGIAWLDTGTSEALLQAATFIQTIEERQGLKVSCIEEIAYKMGYIGSKDILRLASRLQPSPYGDYLKTIVRQGS